MWSRASGELARFSLVLLALQLGCDEARRERAPSNLATTAASSGAAPADAAAAASHSSAPPAVASVTPKAAPEPPQVIPSALGSALGFKPAPEAPTRARTQRRGKWSEVPDTRPGEIRLIRAGAEPRRRLRYDFAVGSGGKLRMLTASDLSIEANGQSQKPGVIPKLELLAQLRVSERSTAGDSFVIDVLGERPRVLRPERLPKLLRAALERSLGQVKELRGESVVSDRGVQRDLRFTSQGPEDPQLQAVLQGLQANLGGMSAPLPAEPIGVGARWVVNNSVMQHGMRLEQLALYELKELSGDRGRAVLEVRQRAPRGELELPGLPPEAKTELVDMQSQGRGETRFDLKNPVPSGKVSTAATIRMQTTLGDEIQNVTLHVKGRLKFEPR